MSEQFKFFSITIAMSRLVASSVFLFLCVGVVLGHSGGTDAQGGHYNRRTGEYHFHHGMGPHQHTGGVCPYLSRADSRIQERTFFQQHPLLTLFGGLLLARWGWNAFGDWRKKKELER